MEGKDTAFFTSCEEKTSALNKQKPVFHYHNGILKATVENRDEMDMVDLGIAKCHFDMGVGCGHFVFGNGGEFAPEV